MRELPDRLFATPVLISIGSSSGSGFLYRTKSQLYLVTAKHVLIEGDGIRNEEIEIACQTKDEDSVRRIRISLKENKPIYDQSTDLVIVKLGLARAEEADKTTFEYCKGVDTLEKGQKNPVTFSRSDIRTLTEVLISNDIYVFGYPTSLGIETQKQFDFNRPLLRRGIVANVYRPAQTIILDCPVYGGNSGGPVIQIIQQDGKKQCALIGVVSQYIPYVQRWKNDRDRLIHLEYLNSGYSVATSMDPVLKLIEHSGDLS